jgi:tricorn protease
MAENELPALRGFNLTDKQQKERQVINGLSDFEFSADGKKLLVRRGATLFIGTVGGKADPVNTSGMNATINSREEWRQIFSEAWRLYRDFFYDPKMHGVDWQAIRERYAPLIEDCASREDVDYVIRQMIAELGVSHARIRLIGDVEEIPAVSVGMLGVDFALHNGAYRIAKIHAGARWDADARNPLYKAGSNVKEGDYLLAVNHVPVDTNLDPWAAFRGLAEQIITLTVSAKPILDTTAREVAVKTLSSEAKLRYRAWVEDNRAQVEQKTSGRVGYIYLADLTNEGLSELGRQFYGQLGKDALIVDLRWNVGGSTPDRFFEMLNRPIMHHWAVRYGAGVSVPIYAHKGPKCLLINEGTGSNAESFAYYFRKAGLGQLIGARTWGGVIGSAGSPTFIDGGAVSIPHHAFTDGNGNIEGHGVEPDLNVVNDSQLAAAIEHIMQELQRAPTKPLHEPAAADRPNQH